MQTYNKTETEMTSEKSPQPENSFHWTQAVWIILLLLIIILGAYFRTLGMDWDDGEYLHPDERFMAFVVSAIHPNENEVSFFDTSRSTMNPNNVGYNWYVYGTTPLFANRIVSDWLVENELDLRWIGKSATGWDMYLVGRYLSAVYDTITIILTFLIGLRLFKKLWPAVIAAGFYAFFALPIQLSHYFTVDIMANMFAMAAFYMAVRIMTRKPVIQLTTEEDGLPTMPSLLTDWTGITEYILFGVFFGLSMACKISVLPIAGLVVLAGLIEMMNLDRKKDRNRRILILIRNLVIAGIVSILLFRIGQPYAFEGPGFFGMIPSEKWISDLKGLSGQSQGLVDFPPALQWSRRPITFGFENLTVWGVGLPLGILAWLAYAWQTVEILRGKWKDHLVMWALTTMFFVWQSVNFTSSMRYYLQIYVPLALTTAWGGWHLLKQLKSHQKKWIWIPITLLAIAFLGTLGYGYAFSRIYSRPATRVAASDWYFQNIPAPINVKIDTTGGEKQQVFGYEAGQMVDPLNPVRVKFTAQQTAIIAKVEFDHIREQYVSSPKTAGVRVTISTDLDGEETIGFGELFGEFGWQDQQFGNPFDLILIEPANVVEGETYYLHVDVLTEGTFLQLTGVAGLRFTSWEEGDQGLQILPEFVDPIAVESPKVYTFDPKWDGVISRIEIPHIVDVTGDPNAKTLSVRLSALDDPQTTYESTITNTFAAETDIRGNAYEFDLAQPFPVKQGSMVQMEFLVEGESGVAFYGTKQAAESSWDDAVPLRRSGYDPFGANIGEYRSELNFEMYWDDNEEKRDRFLSILDQADLIMITSSRQWGTTTRVPERYPMTTMYYRELIGCPPEEEIFWCYAVAEPNMFEGNLGFELKQVFQSNPNIGSFEINDQFAEEAFKVYDHPKVLIFEKTDDYDREAVREKFFAVDLSTVMHMIPAEVPLHPRNLMLPTTRWNQQKELGTWSELYRFDNLLNQSEVWALIVFYLFITLLGIIIYPMTSIVFSGLQAKGYAVSRLFGLLLFAFLSWLLGSAGIDLTQTAIWLVFILLVLVNGLIFYRNREEILSAVKQNWNKILVIEAVAIVFFLIFILIRLGNPDLWHPYKGGEKPMDFSYLNAVLKSTTFPPYDPWFAGGYINYYYYGFVIVGMPIKALGIEPAVAYNLVLAMVFSLFALMAYAIGTTLYAAILKPAESEKDHSLIGGITTILLTLIASNFGTIQMLFSGFIRLGGGHNEMTGFQRFGALINGIELRLQGNLLPYYPGDWYWIPSRMIEGEPITEFPFFTFLYADLHAHMIAMPITLLLVAWCISILQHKFRWNGVYSWAKKAFVLISGGMIAGALRPTNTWDFPVFLVLAAITLGYVLFTSIKYRFRKGLPFLSNRVKTMLIHFLVIGVFVLTALYLYSPFTYWYGQGYSSIKVWDGSTTKIGEYFAHWGILLSLIIVWFTTDTYHLLGNTPVSALKKIRKLQVVILVGFSLFVALLLSLAFLDIQVHWVALVVAIWAALLMLQPNIPSTQRFVYFLTGTGLFLTTIVEVIVLDGDIGRMNTVFKFYLQAWNLLAIVAAVGFTAFLLRLLKKNLKPIHYATSAVLGVFLMCGFLFAFVATADKIEDRMAKDAPHVLDGFAYMDYATYNDQGQEYRLVEDAEAIRWMQQFVKGTPVIIEGNTPEYRWGTRFTINTGLPSVVGWNWHQRQQRTYLETEAVQNRVNDVNLFYTTTNIDETKLLLRRYEIEYIIVGQLEDVYYPESGLEKFAEYEGELWSLVYSNSGTSIYQVKDWE